MTRQASEIIKDWPDESREAAELVIQTYGEPGEATDSLLTWMGVGPWKRVHASRTYFEHQFPAPHIDSVESVIDYHVPAEWFTPLAQFDGSVVVERTAGEVSARCHDEQANFLALNLMHDIVEGARGVDDARAYYAEEFLNARRKEPTPLHGRAALPAGDRHRRPGPAGALRPGPRGGHAPGRARAGQRLTVPRRRPLRRHWTAVAPCMKIQDARPAGERSPSMREQPPNMTDYLETRASFRLEVPEVYNYARDVVDDWAAREPDKLALQAVGPDGGEVGRFSFADLAASSNRAARFLQSLGVGKGDPVFVMLPRIHEWYDVVLGCIKLGAVPMPGTTLLTDRDIAYRMEHARSRVAVTDPEGMAKVDRAAERMGVELTRACVRADGAGPGDGWASWEEGLATAGEQPPEVEPTRADDPMLVYFTSGTVA
jgi:hypothetical protein